MVLFLKNNSLKHLTIAIKQRGGRNCNGRITTYSRGCLVKQRYRLIETFSKKSSQSLGIIRSFSYDLSRKVYLALVCSRAGFLHYQLAVQGMYVGQVLGNNLDINMEFLTNYGSTAPLSQFELGNFISNIVFKLGARAVCTKAAGTRAILLKKYKNKVLIRLPSGQYRLLSNNCYASFGQIAFADFKFNSLTKAGTTRLLGFKPHVRGVAKNPVDHPHGGGEGKTSGGRCSVTPWGILTKGYPTVRGKKRKIRLKANLF